MTVRAFMNFALRRAGSAAFLLLAACSSRIPVAVAPLPDRPWTLLPGDEVRVRVYREPELNGQWIVNGRGELQLPGIGRMVVAGLTVDSLTELISRGYARHIIDAIVDVGIVRTVPVLGDVRTPGAYSVEPTNTVQQLVARAGGLDFSGLESAMLLLVKGRDGTKYSLSADQRLDRVPIDGGDAILVVNPNQWSKRVDNLVRLSILVTLVMQIILFTRL